MTHVVARARAKEIKFVVDPEVAGRIRAWARIHLQPDIHGRGPYGDEYETTSLYFDTAAYDVFHRRASFGRAKYRIRRYGSGRIVFLERKLRTADLLAKRRTSVSIEELERLADFRLKPEATFTDVAPGFGPEASAFGPVGSGFSPAASDVSQKWEGDWFARRLIARGLQPTCQIAYSRMARGITTSDGSVRLTLDDSISVLPLSQVRFWNTRGVPVLDDQRILELKFRGYVPAIFRRLVDEFALTPQSASKYRLGLSALTADAAADADTAPAGVFDACA